MNDSPERPLRRGWTTGACATAATRAALHVLWGEGFPETVTITLPGGARPSFDIAFAERGSDGGREWAEAGVIKDAGDDPDVTHGALIRARVAPGRGGIVFAAGEGVGTVTKPGLPVAIGAPAINPVPRQMMRETVEDLARRYNRAADVEITLSIPGGAALARKTWNPRLGIEGGLSILGTTGIVRPFSCSAWIASIHRGIDVARASGLEHVAGCTGNMSEKAVQALYGLPDHAMLDMGDFAGGLLKYLIRHPLPRLTIGGGIGKLAKLAQGATDLHSKRSQVDIKALNALARKAGLADVSGAHTAFHALGIAGPGLAQAVAGEALARLDARLQGSGIRPDVVVVDRQGRVVGRAGP